MAVSGPAIPSLIPDQAGPQPVLPQFAGSFFPEDFEEKALAQAWRWLGAFIAKHIPGAVKARGHATHGVTYEKIMHAATALQKRALGSALVFSPI